MPNHKASRWVRCKIWKESPGRVRLQYVSEWVQEQQGPRPLSGFCTSERLSPEPLQPSLLLLYNPSLLPRHTFCCTEKAAVSWEDSLIVSEAGNGVRKEEKHDLLIFFSRHRVEKTNRVNNIVLRTAQSSGEETRGAGRKQRRDV